MCVDADQLQSPALGVTMSYLKNAVKAYIPFDSEIKDELTVTTKSSINSLKKKTGGFGKLVSNLVKLRRWKLGKNELLIPEPMPSMTLTETDEITVPLREACESPFFSLDDERISESNFPELFTPPVLFAKSPPISDPDYTIDETNLGDSFLPL